MGSKIKKCPTSPEESDKNCYVCLLQLALKSKKSNKFNGVLPSDPWHIFCPIISEKLRKWVNSEVPKEPVKAGNAMRTLSYAFPGVNSRHLKTTSIETTLYDLIEAISEEIKTGEDHLIAQTVFHLINSGRLKFIDIPKDFKSICS